MPRHTKGARLWLRPARRKGGRVIARAIWIIVDGKKHIATGCFEHQAGQAERQLAAYIADKYEPSRLAKDIEKIDVADVLSIYLDDCGPRFSDLPKLERTIGRLNDYWGGKMLAEVTASECRAYIKARGRTGGARADLETLRAAINHHARESLHYGTVRVTLPPKGPPARPVAYSRRGSQTDLGMLAVSRTTDRASWSRQGPASSNRQTATPTSRSVHTDRSVYRHAGKRDRRGVTIPRLWSLVRRSRPRYILPARHRPARDKQTANTGADTGATPRSHAALGPSRNHHVAFRRMARCSSYISQDGVPACS
jgi:hypothetical protein